MWQFAVIWQTSRNGGEGPVPSVWQWEPEPPLPSPTLLRVGSSTLSHITSFIPFFANRILYQGSHTLGQTLSSVPWRLSHESELPHDQLHWWKLMENVFFNSLKLRFKIPEIDLFIIIYLLLYNCIWINDYIHFHES